MNIYEKDYSELVDKEIVYIESDGHKHAGIVVGCDPYIGITVMEKHTNMYLLCLCGPTSEFYKASNDSRFYERYFISMIGQLRKGRFSNRIDNKFNAALTNGDVTRFGNPSARTCPFNQ